MLPITMSKGLKLVKSGKDSVLEWTISRMDWHESAGRATPTFQFEGDSWWLFVASKGGYIVLEIGRSASSPSPIDVEFSVSVKATDGRRLFERRERHCFEGTKFYSIADYYEIKEWISISELIRREREWLTELSRYKHMTILFTMKKIDSGECEIASAEEVCSCCKESRQGESLHKIPIHEKCLNQPIMCPNCVEIVSLQKWFGHKCEAANVKSECSTSQSSVSRHKEKPLQDLKKLFLNQENCDLVLRVQGQEFSAHQAVLTARSPVFASTFRSNMREKETGAVDIEDVDPSCFSEFLCFLYCGELDKLSAENVHSLFFAADKYQIMDLRAICLEFMKNNLSVDKFCETLTLALLHTETELIDSCTDYFVRNAEEILITVKWKTFVAENPTQSNELIIKYVKHVKQFIK